MKKVLALMAVAGLATAASAQVAPIADVTFAPGVGAIHTDGNTNAIPSAWTFWLFCANAGDTIEWEVNRLVDAMDPIASVMDGDMTGTPFAAIGGIGDDPMAGFDSVSLSDDADPPHTGGGPFGDPHAVFVAPTTGTYTIAVSNFLGDPIPPGGYAHEVIVRGSTCIPAPGSLALLGLGGLVAARRRRA